MCVRLNDFTKIGGLEVFYAFMRNQSVENVRTFIRSIPIDSHIVQCSINLSAHKSQSFRIEHTDR